VTKTRYFGHFHSSRAVELQSGQKYQTYKVWTQVSFDFSLDFILFYFLLSSILGIGVRVSMTSLSYCHKSQVTVMVTSYKIAIEGSRKIWKDDTI